MSKKTIGYALVALGAVIQVISLSADFIGLGQHPEIIGSNQLLGAAIGLIIILVGVWFVSRKTD